MKRLISLLLCLAAPAFAADEVTILRGTPAPAPPVVVEPPPPPPPVVIYQPVPYPQPFYVLPMWWQEFPRPHHGTGRIGIAR